MPPPIKVELVSHDPNWGNMASTEAEMLAKAIGPLLLTVHHIGSTSIPGIRAKPILDLMPLVRDLTELDNRRRDIEGLGYEYWGELGLPGRRYCTKADPSSHRRLVQLHCYEDGFSEIARHLAFRDYLRGNAAVAIEYDLVKGRCQSLHPGDSHAYGACKSAWINRAEVDALNWYRSR